VAWLDYWYRAFSYIADLTCSSGFFVERPILELWFVPCLSRWTRLALL